MYINRLLNVTRTNYTVYTIQRRPMTQRTPSNDDRLHSVHYPLFAAVLFRHTYVISVKSSPRPGFEKKLKSGATLIVNEPLFTSRRHHPRFDESIVAYRRHHVFVSTEHSYMQYQADDMPQNLQYRSFAFLPCV